MSVLASITDGGGTATATGSAPTQGFPFPPGFSISSGRPLPNTTTVTSVETILPIVTIQTTTTLATFTNVSTTTTFSTSTNVISTFTQTTLSVTELPNPEATAGLGAAQSLLTSNATLTRTNITVTLVLGILIFVLLVGIAVFFCLQARRRKKALRDDESPPFTSLAPRPAPFPTSTRGQIPSASQLRPPSNHETSLSMGPRGGTAGSYNRALEESQARTSAPTLSHPLTRPSRSFSAPVNAPEPAPRLPAFDLPLPSLNIMPATPSASMSSRLPQTAGSRSPSPVSSTPTPPQPVLRRTQPTLQRVPMYHAALQQQAQRQRQSATVATAERLGLPVVTHAGAEERGSVETMGSDVSGFEDNGRGNEGMGKMGGGRTPVVHSTRASSGVFPVGKEEEEEEREREELERAMKGKGKQREES